MANQWYAIALLTAPLIVTPLLFIFSLYSPVFLPGIVTSADKVTAIMTGIVTGVLFGGLMEELGWTGFAVPILLKRFSTFKTGLIIGILHGVCVVYNLAAAAAVWIVVAAIVLIYHKSKEEKL